MTDGERVETIRTYIAEIERIKNAHPKGTNEHSDDIEKILFGLRVIWKLHEELQKHDREDMLEEFREWANEARECIGCSAALPYGEKHERLENRN